MTRNPTVIDIADDVARNDRDRERCSCGPVRAASFAFTVLIASIPTFAMGVAVGLFIAKVLR